MAIFITGAGLHKASMCVKIATTALHLLKLWLAAGTGTAKFKACDSKNFRRRLNINTFPVTCYAVVYEYSEVKIHPDVRTSAGPLGTGVAGLAAGHHWFLMGGVVVRAGTTNLVGNPLSFHVLSPPGLSRGHHAPVLLV